MRFVEDKDIATDISGREYEVGSATYIAPPFSKFCNLFMNPLESVGISKILKEGYISSKDLEEWREMELIDITDNEIEFTTYGLKYYKKNKKFQQEIKENTKRIKF